MRDQPVSTLIDAKPARRLNVETDGESRRIVWKTPVYNTVRGFLANPVYA